MKKILIALLLTLSVAFILSGCSSTETTTDTSATDNSIVGSWTNTTDEMGVGKITFTYTFNEDDSFTLAIEDSTTDDQNTNQPLNSTTTGTYTLDGDQLTLSMNLGSSQEAVENSNASDQVGEELAQDLVVQPDTYTISINGNQLSMTDSSGDTIIYTRA